MARLLINPQELISTLALGSTFANCIILGIGFLVIIDQSTWQIVGYGFLLLGGILGFCEILPKTLAIRSAERWALRLAKPVWALATSSPSVDLEGAISLMSTSCLVKCSFN